MTNILSLGPMFYFRVIMVSFLFFLNLMEFRINLKELISWKEELNIKTKEKIQVVDQFTIYRIDFQWLNTMNDFRYYKR